MGHRVRVLNLDRGGVEVARARWCASFLCRLRGLTFRRRLDAGEALLLVERRASRLGAAIHMWAVFFPLGVAWLSDDLVVVDRVVAQPWRVYLPAAPARYILEAAPAMLESLAVGERLAFEDLVD